MRDNKEERKINKATIISLAHLHLSLLHWRMLLKISLEKTNELVVSARETVKIILNHFTEYTIELT